MTAKPLSEDQMVNMVRNALLVAGHEMGHVGDHWPVVNATIHDIMKNWEDVKIERNVFTEVKTHYETMIQELVAIRNATPVNDRGEMDGTIEEVRAIYRACFEQVSEDGIYMTAEDQPPHLARAAAILNTLEEDHE